jgi:hypothetical protein
MLIRGNFGGLGKIGIIGYVDSLRLIHCFLQHR